MMAAALPNTLTAMLSRQIRLGTRLLLQDIPADLHRRLSVCHEEEVTFTQVTADANDGK
jgi:hypothetical protein